MGPVPAAMQMDMDISGLGIRMGFPSVNVKKPPANLEIYVNYNVNDVDLGYLVGGKDDGPHTIGIDLGCFRFCNNNNKNKKNNDSGYGDENAPLHHAYGRDAHDARNNNNGGATTGEAMAIEIVTDNNNNKFCCGSGSGSANASRTRSCNIGNGVTVSGDNGSRVNGKAPGTGASSKYHQQQFRQHAQFPQQY